MTAFNNRNVILPALFVLAALLLALGLRRNTAAAGCDEHPVVASVEHTAKDRPGGGGCAQLRSMPASMDQPGAAIRPAPDPTIALSRAAQPDPIAALRLSILNGAVSQNQPLKLSPLAAAFRWPVAGPITQAFGVPELGVGAPHTGLDIGQDAGSLVRAAAAGRVVFAGGDPCCGLGYWVEINHGDRYSTRYGHLMRPPVVLAGDYVNQGQVLGFSGTTGFSTGPHLHFEVRLDGIPIDPLRVLPSR